ncbi:MAG TPA: UDP-N-acetylmuramoyl-L-alanyl-D-glutamate--2,6-diaminopimelate ligase [Candidatus Dormibacteraeota bacterium]|nr:UDP-N-acetylmuramoyl-L-alanyl-D-glutamate--2,6-diaminopimelate ligase [Candidatus Dormibacteraeota bacterium]
MMPMIKLTELLSVIPFYKVIGNIEETYMNKIEMDHRKINSGDAFVCLRGFTVDGHDYAEQAVEKGATIIIAEQDMKTSVATIVVPDTSRALAFIAAKFYDFPTSKLSLIGITGTNGKTTTTYLLEAIFKQDQKNTGLIGTIQMKIGDKTYPVNNTTPDSLLLQKTFKQMVDEEIDTAIMEVSSHALDLGRVHGCDYDVALFTNLSLDHLDYHKDLDDYLRVKSLLFAQLGNSYRPGDRKFAILNADDPASQLIKKSTAQHILTYGCKSNADMMAKNIELRANGTKFTLKTPIGEIEINSQLVGMFNVYNMLAASSIAVVQHVDLQVIKEALENISGVHGRFEQVNKGQRFSVIVDYAHTPDSLENVLQTITEFSKRRIFVVVGCGGDRDRSKRPLMANIAVKYADQAIFTSDNPRTENPLSILNDMTDHLKETNYEVIDDRKQAIFRAIDLAKDDDIILIAGKGHETYQEINRVKYDFDDREIASEAIKQKES